MLPAKPSTFLEMQQGLHRMSKISQITVASIQQLVYHFYGKVRRDKRLGPVFEGVIGTTSSAWEPHLERMVCFWSAVMLASGAYHGDPVKKHQAIPNLSPDLFEHWLMLFEQAAQDLLEPEIAEDYALRSRRIAANLSRAVGVA